MFDGRELQHASVRFQAMSKGTTLPFFTLRSIKLSDTAEKEHVYDSQGQAVSYVIKPHKPALSMSLLSSEWKLGWDYFTQRAIEIENETQEPTGVGQVEFSSLLEIGLGSKKIKRKIVTCLVVTDQYDSKDDQAALVTEVPIFCLRILDENDRTLIRFRRR